MKTDTITDWSKPKDVSALDMAFGGRMGDLLPAWDIIPEEFRNHGRTKWHKVQSRWFYSGLPEGTDFKAKDGIDGATALRHLASIQRSFEPKHEHKEAAVAWLMSLWFDDIIIPTPA